jgi:hypothetical protein
VAKHGKKGDHFSKMPSPLFFFFLFPPHNEVTGHMTGYNRPFVAAHDLMDRYTGLVAVSESLRE